MATTTVTLIQCTDSKRDTGAKARNLYDESRYFRKMRAWAEARGDPWYILSAKHGLVHPDAIIFPYDERGLVNGDAYHIADKLASVGVEVVHICAGRDYTEDFIPYAERSYGFDIVNHFAGEKIGRREELLVEATKRLENESL